MTVRAGVRPADVVSSQGHYAGSVSRFLAYVVDLGASTLAFTLGLAALSFAAQVVTGQPVHWNRSDIAVAVVFVVWQFCYFGCSWAASGRTFGMALLGIRVVRADGATLAWDGRMSAQARSVRPGLSSSTRLMTTPSPVTSEQDGWHPVPGCRPRRPASPVTDEAAARRDRPRSAGIPSPSRPSAAGDAARASARNR